MSEELDLLLRLVRQFEGCKLTPYYCPAGVLTCGWGATGAGVYPGAPWTQAQADARLESDALKFLRGTKALCPELEGHRLAAVADFAYNLGLGNLRGSTLRKRLNSGDYAAALVELRKWTRAGGRILPGLIRRREAEARLFLQSQHP